MKNSQTSQIVTKYPYSHKYPMSDNFFLPHEIVTIKYQNIENLQNAQNVPELKSRLSSTFKPWLEFPA